MPNAPVRNLVLILGDQLNPDNPALEGFDPRQDRILMVEAVGEGAQVWSHKARIAVFLAAMRHFAQVLRKQHRPVDYLALGEHPHAQLLDAWRTEIARLRPQRIVACEPGEWRIEQDLRKLERETGVPVVLREDTHFLISRADFARWADKRRHLLMENFYRMMRQRTGLLMQGKEPEGGAWNYDQENRGAFGKAGPGKVPAPPKFVPDDITRATLKAVEQYFPDHPGSLEHFHWPVTRAQALKALHAFIDDRLPHFGQYQDAMWSGEPFLYHALISCALNLKLLNPKEVVEAAARAHAEGKVPLPAAEGFIRQILGWREFIRGVYWSDMPALKEANHLKHKVALPGWYWTGKTNMNCMRQCIGDTLAHGYAHHIQRLMVTGNFALVAGITPQQVCDWYLAVYVDAVEWVELPNTAGMSLYANGGRFTSKPYAASGAYIKRMSNYCAGCTYRAEVKTGPRACPMTTFYWDFLDRHAQLLAGNTRATLMLRNLERLSGEERDAIRAEAARMRRDIEAI